MKRLFEIQFKIQQAPKAPKDKNNSFGGKVGELNSGTERDFVNANYR